MKVWWDKLDVTGRTIGNTGDISAVVILKGLEIKSVDCETLKKWSCIRVLQHWYVLLMI